MSKRKKAKKKAAKKVAKKTRVKSRKYPVASVKSLTKRPLSQLLTLGDRVSKAMRKRVELEKKISRRTTDQGILAGLFAGPRRASRADKERMEMEEVIRELQP